MPRTGQDSAASLRPLVVSGSRYPESGRQIQSAAQSFGTRVSYFNPVADSEISLDASREGTISIASIVAEPVAPSACPQEEIIPRFTQAIDRLIRRMGFDGLAIVGGETAYHLFRRLGATRLDVSGRVAEVVARGAIADGLMAGRPFASKGGSVGHDNAVIRMVDSLR